MEQKTDKQLKREFVHYLRHYRHQILNDIQLLKGYLALGRMDAVQNTLDQMVIKSHAEGEISRIADVELAYLLLTYNYRQNRLQLSVDVQMEGDDIADVGREQTFLSSLLSQTMDKIKEGCLQERENHLSIIFETNEADYGVKVEYEGSWEPLHAEERLEQLQHLFQDQPGKIVKRIYNEETLQLNIEISVPR